MTAADQIVGRIVLAAKARLASREAATEVKRKSATQRRLNLPGKLADCKSTDLDETELFIVEGDSAGGSAKQGRNNRTQAVLPLRGKILNSEGLPLSKVLANPELTDLVTAIGTGAGEKFDLGGLRYGKIILLMDADADGHHITTLMLAFFFRHMPELIRKGHVYIAQPPLYRIDVGKETYWARDDAHKEEILAGLRANAKPEITRSRAWAKWTRRCWPKPRSTRATARCCAWRSNRTWRRTSASWSCWARIPATGPSSSWSRRDARSRRNWTFSPRDSYVRGGCVPGPISCTRSRKRGSVARKRQKTFRAGRRANAL